jgi:hypothetical protein
VVLFLPLAAGTETATLSVADNGSGSPQVVSLSGAGTHDVVLSWTASPTSGILGYELYRGTSPGGEGSSPINATPVAGTTYTDSSVTAGITYYYTITSLLSSGSSQSSGSSEVSAAVP